MTANRWKCPQCGGTDLSVSIPTWYREDADGTLTLVQIDEDADPLWWLCNNHDCCADGQHEPARNEVTP